MFGICAWSVCLDTFRKRAKRMRARCMRRPYGTGLSFLVIALPTLKRGANLPRDYGAGLRAFVSAYY